ncbi:MAG TPA: ATP-binding protein [Myxococcaceae bacterium]|nr:ATP-binding protein [Myxococcaceae bacterium]
MSNPSDSRAPQASPGVTASHGAWFTAWLDRLLSEPLRASPAVLARSRVVVAAACFMFVFALLFAVSAPFSPTTVMCLPVALGYLGTLVLARRAASPLAPATLLCLTMFGAFIGGVFLLEGAAYTSTHAVHMLLPALAVYLIGPRRALWLTVPLILALELLLPLWLQSRLVEGSAPDAFFWVVHLCAAFGLVGAWGLGSLSTTERDKAQRKLEHTLDELRESQLKLFSLFESTDDMVLSLDLQGRLLLANTAAREMYRRRFGQEPMVGQPFFVPTDSAAIKLWEARMARVLSGERVRAEETHEVGGARIVLDISISPIVGAGGRITALTIFSRDITSRKEAETRLAETHRTLMDVSRQAGMAEVATGVLHNVGNTLNSVNISAGLLEDLVRKSRVVSLAKAMGVLREHASELGTFLTTEPQGRKLPPYLFALSDQLQQERESLLRELQSLSNSVEHIKNIVNMQQKHARVAGALEQLPVAPLIDEALRLHSVSFERLGISIESEYSEAPAILLDRHKLLQILVNLLSNARHAVMASDRPDKRLTIRVRRASDAKSVLVEVADNGVGIAPENLSRIFTQGFTTKKTGHGFGLHSSALAAAEMKGRLSCSSPGPGLGTTFTLELPIDGAPL